MIREAVNYATTRLLPRLLSVDAGRRLSILVYHRVLPEVDPMRPGIPDVAGFNWQMKLIREHFHPLSLNEALERLEQGDLPRRAVCVTFDDGYADNLVHALPVLQRWNIPATVYVASGFLDGGRMWNDSVIEAFSACAHDQGSLPELGLEILDLSTPVQRRQACYEVIRRIKYLPPDQRLLQVEAICKALGQPHLPQDLMLTRQQLQQLAAAQVEIGNHTVSHPVLTAVDDATVMKELQQSSCDIEAVIQQPVRHFAYPNGIPGTDFNPRHRQLIKDLGFASAVTTHWGVAAQTTNRWELPRFTPWDQTPQRFAARLIMNMKSLR